MPAVQETVEQVRRIDVDQYKHGRFETKIESEKAPKGLRKTRSASSRPRKRTGMDAGVETGSLRALADHA